MASSSLPLCYPYPLGFQRLDKQLHQIDEQWPGSYAEPVLIRESFCESGEGVRLPRERADLQGCPGNFRGSPGNFRGSLGNFRGTPGLL